jgi:hypothetical protein
MIDFTTILPLTELKYDKNTNYFQSKIMNNSILHTFFAIDNSNLFFKTKKC